MGPTANHRLLIDPIFPGTKLRWLLDNVEGALKTRARAGQLALWPSPIPSALAP